MSSIFRRFSGGSARLGDLLVQAGILTPNQLQEAMRSSRSKKLQIGQVLVMSGYMTSRDLQIVLEAQSALRDRTIDLNLAIQCIKVARKIGGNFSDVLEDYDASAAQRARTGKLGELLSEAGLIGEEDLSEAMERSVNTGMPLGRMLVLNRILSSEVLQKALEIQVRLRDEVVTRDEAIMALRQAAGLEGEPAPAPAHEEKKQPVVRLGELLVMAGILSETDVMDALEWGLANQQPIGHVLVSQELISKELLDASLFFQTAVREGKIDAMKACELLSEVFSTGVSPEEALADAAPTNRKELEVAPITYQQLLTLSRIVSDAQIEEAFDLKRHGAALIGKVLVLTGLMDVPTLQATLRCYGMVAKGYLSPDDAIVSLDYCLHKNANTPMAFEQALRDLKWNPETGLKMRGEPADDTTSSSTKLDQIAAEPVKKEEVALAPAATKKAEAEKAEADNEPTAKSTTAATAEPPPVAKKLADLAAGVKKQPAEATTKQTKSQEAKSDAADGVINEKSNAEPTKVKNSNKDSKSEPSLARALASLYDDGADGDDGAAEPALDEEPLAVENEKESAPAGLRKLLDDLSDSDEPAEANNNENPASESSLADLLTDSQEVEKVAGNNNDKKLRNLFGDDDDDDFMSSSTEEEAVTNESLDSDEPEEIASPQEVTALAPSNGKDDTEPVVTPVKEETEVQVEPVPEPEPEAKKVESAPQLEVPESPVEAPTVPKPAVVAGEDEEDIAKMSAEQLLVEIMKSAQNPDAKHGTVKRGGRFSETILPEDAKARQLAKLVGKESSRDLAEKTQAFDGSEENTEAAFQRLAETYFEQGNYKEAQVIYERMLVHRLNDLGPDNPLLVEDYNNLAMTLCVQGRFDKAEPFMKRAVHLFESTEAPDAAELADYLHSLGTIQYKLEKYKDAEEIMLRVVSIRRDALEDDHEDIGRALGDYAKVLKKLGKNETAEAIYKKAREIMKKNRDS
ncbi:MAG: tetratricopeptide repeat protein [Candidatus Obscuribacterales bacterium]|nr:tetratricopeptide repeat protein [Candidatus Obscuribacterales bacterium]